MADPKLRIRSAVGGPRCQKTTKPRFDRTRVLTRSYQYTSLTRRDASLFATRVADVKVWYSVYNQRMYASSRHTPEEAIEYIVT